MGKREEGKGEGRGKKWKKMEGVEKVRGKRREVKKKNEGIRQPNLKMGGWRRKSC